MTWNTIELVIFATIYTHCLLTKQPAGCAAISICSICCAILAVCCTICIITTWDYCCSGWKKLHQTICMQIRSLHYKFKNTRNGNRKARREQQCICYLFQFSGCWCWVSQNDGMSINESFCFYLFTPLSLGIKYIFKSQIYIYV